MSLLFNYCTSIAKNESPSKIFDWKIYLYRLLYDFPLFKRLKHKQKPPHLVEASCFINTILSHEGQLGRLGCMGYDEV